MSYLVLHIDVEFIVGTVCADNGTASLITNGKEELLWLYFFNNPHQNSITYGKDNKAHFNNSEINYYGKLFDKIEKEQETFLLRGIEHPIIDLLKESGLLDNIRKTYLQKTLDNTQAIPTLLTFSLSIGDNAKQKTVDYLKTNGFEIKSYTIPLAELVSYHTLNNKKLKVGNGSVAIFLEATNPTLHLMKLALSDNYFLMDGKPQTREGMGFDPRKLALLRFVVNEANKSIGALFSESEKVEECKRLELQADDWLKKLDATNSNMPYNIRAVSFSKMPNSKKDVLVRKSDLDSDTGSYTQGLKDIFDAFHADNVQGDVTAVILMGNCFQSERVKTSFEQMVGADKLFFYANNDIHNILSVYPKIDITRYASEEARIKERAKAEELKQAEQRAFEDRQRKEREMAAQKAATEQKAEENRKEAKKLFDRAVGLEKEGKLEDARVNTENAIALELTNREYKQFLDDLKDKIKNLNDKNELYKKYLSNADKLLKDGELEKALEEYEAAKFVFDNAEIIAKIIEVKRLIKNSETQKKQIEQLVSEASSLIQNKKFDTAKDKIDAILANDSSNAEAKKLLTKIDEFLKQQEKLYNDYIKSADKHFNSSIFTDALDDYKQALSIRPDDTYCLQQIDKISDTIQKQKENKEKCEKIMEKGDALFQDERWIEAQSQYQLALNLCPEVKSALSKLNECNSKIKEQEDTFTDLLLQANILEKKGKMKNALESLEAAKKIRPDNEDIKKRIKNIKFNLDFEDDANSSSVANKPSKANINKQEDFFDLKPKLETTKKNDDNDDFLGIKTTKTTLNNKPVEDDFFAKKPKKTIDDEDDFLGLKKKN